MGFFNQIKEAAFIDEIEKISMSLNKITSALAVRRVGKVRGWSPQRSRRFVETHPLSPGQERVSSSIQVGPGSPWRSQMKREVAGEQGRKGLSGKTYLRSFEE